MKNSGNGSHMLYADETRAQRKSLNSADLCVRASLQISLRSWESVKLVISVLFGGTN